MEVEVKLYGQLRRYRPQGLAGASHHPFNYTVAAGATAASLAAELGIPSGFINAVAVNGGAVEAEVTLQPGDTVGLFPPSAGG